MTEIRVDHQAISKLIRQGSKVLDVGCGDGSLLSLLRKNKQIDARGLELLSEGVEKCISKGLSVVQGDGEVDLDLFSDDQFDVAILSKTIQEMRRPATILRELSRVAPEVIISFKNYGHWRKRLQLLIRGRMPTSRTKQWHDADALHPSTVTDMLDLCAQTGLQTLGIAPQNGSSIGEFGRHSGRLVNFFAEDAILHLCRV